MAEHESMLILEVEEMDMHYFYRLIKCRDRKYIIMRESYPSGDKKSFHVTRALVDYALSVPDEYKLGLLISLYEYAKRHRWNGGGPAPSYQGPDTGRLSSLYCPRL